MLEVAAQINKKLVNFIIDTGAAVSILPLRYAAGICVNPTAVRLRTADGKPLACHGEVSVEIDIPMLRRTFRWTFVVAETMFPLIGIDFLSHFDLSVDCSGRTLLDKTTKRTISLVVSALRMNNVSSNTVSTHKNIVDLLEKYKSLTSTKNNTLGSEKNSKVFHRIDTGNSKPTYAKARQLSEEKFKAVKQEFQSLLEAGIIRPSKSPWSSPLHLVPKGTTGKYRPCGDYRYLNANTKPDRYPLPHIQSVSSKLHGKCIYSKIDMIHAYHQVSVHPEDVEKTAVTTPFGLYEYVYMPFGLRNSAATFQRFMDNIFMDSTCVFVYLDDILVFSSSEEQHLKDLDETFGLLNSHNLRISLDKCKFMVTQVDFLGYSISKHGMKPTSRKVSEISQFPLPESSKALRRFLGMVGFYRKLIPNFANLVFPLTELIKQYPSQKQLEHSDEVKEAFARIKNELANISSLPYPDSASTHYQLVTDSSQFAMGSALHQMIDNEPVPIGFFSKKLSDRQRRDSTFDRELLAAYASVLHFKPQIEGRHVTLFSDHKPLVSAFYSCNQLKSDKQQRQLSLISEYVSDMVYIRGDQNIVADCLSRPVQAVSVDLYDLPSLLELQKADAETQSKIPELKSFPVGSEVIWCDTSIPSPRPFVPLPARKSIFDSLHNLSHPGVKASVKLIKSRYFWPDIDRNIRNWCRECQPCQQSKVFKHTKSDIQHYDFPSARFETVHIDIVGPLPPSKQHGVPYTSPYRYLFTCIDRATRWIEATPMSDITAASVAVAFLQTWISRFGVPLIVISDRGTQFESELFRELSTLVGFHRLRTAAYTPKTNGMVERTHRSIKAALMARKQNWLDSLPIVLLGLRALINESGFSPASAVTGTSLLCPRPLLTNCEENFTSETVKKLATEMLKFNFHEMSEGVHHSPRKSYIPKDLYSCTHVWVRIDRVRRSLEAPYSGPFLVLERHPKYFVVRTVTGSTQLISVDRLKPAYLSSKQTEDSTKPQKPPDVATQSESSTQRRDSSSEDATKKYVTRFGRSVKFRT